MYTKTEISKHIDKSTSTSDLTVAQKEVTVALAKILFNIQEELAKISKKLDEK